MNDTYHEEPPIYEVNGKGLSLGMAKTRCEYLKKRRIDFVIEIYHLGERITLDKNEIPESWQKNTTP